MAPHSQRSALSRWRRGVTASSLLLAAVLSSTAISVTDASAAGTKNVLNFTEQEQSKDNWCWAATGASIAAYKGHSVSQNSFCNAAFGRSQDSTCPNNQATLGNDQTAYRWLGMTPGTYITGTVNYAKLQSEIDSDRPVQTRIGWSSGGGHMEVLYGYDTSTNYVYWGDPWPDDYRYNWATYSYYRDNSDFTWTHTLYGIGA
ncbi:C39 family peptidase [Streptomyces sp. LP11]|uniref:C39 family peptidase n=1 Tax=Streptomyces pyxinicus TaxID=2970331 RepID=A0ABT2B8K8_9ACTN|nr:papain-like cysteine protease family protein [Streptomyces sp. LP11]MCS0604410.1 C39 family peptidase [Streptomyces sp. LP11]